MNTRARAVQTPGAPAAEPEANTVTNDTAAASVEVGQGTTAPEVPAIAVGGEETVTVSKADLSALLAEVKGLKAQVRGMQSNPANATRRLVNPEAVLPDQSEIDPNTIKTPQLSKQGWVVPTGFGANPAQKGL